MSFLPLPAFMGGKLKIAGDIESESYKSSSRSALASCKSVVSNPSVNQP